MSYNKEQLSRYALMAEQSGIMDNELYTRHDVKRGLRDINGKGVVAGLTEISEIIAFEDDGVTPAEGKLLYRGYNIRDLAKGFLSDKRFGLEEVAFLLLFGDLPNKAQYEEFLKLISEERTLPDSFTRNSIMNIAGKDLTNMIARCVLSLYAYDENADDTSIENVIYQSVSLIARLPVIAVYSYHAYNHKSNNQSLVIHPPKPEYSIAENILHMLRPDSEFTELEARILDLTLTLHAEHGGGNNSTFTNHVVTSSGTDTYSAVVASLCSLKGPRHGGANVKVVEMIDDLKANVSDWENEDEIAEYIRKLLNKQAYDRQGLVYGMGHAVYSLSDPRSELMKSFAEKLAIENNCIENYNLYTRIARIAPQVIAEERKIYKGVSANVDFYSGLVYRMLNLPEELYTPLFAIARICGWSAHRIEELVNRGKIIRPAYKAVSQRRDYINMEER